MNIAVVGGGKRCARLMDVIQRHRFEEIDPRIVAVADPRPEAPGMVKALEKGLQVTGDYNDFFDRGDIDLIIELTNSMDVYNDILAKKRKDVRAISTATAQLFWEISRVSTLQKKYRQELYETRALYQVLINQLIQEDVLVIARNHRILDANDTLLKKLGLCRDEAIGKYCYQITHRQDVPCSGDQHPCPLIQTLETEKPSQTTHIHRDRDNNEIYYSISTYPLLEDEEVVGAIEVSRDITADINMQKALMQNEKLASVGRLSAGVAHEINNPLTSILTTAMLIQEDLESEHPLHEDLEIIVKETLRCRKIVTSLLEFARQNTPRRQKNDLNEIVAESILLTRKQAAFKDVVVDEKLDEGLPAVRVDKGQFQQVLINLILNGVQATPAGGLVEIRTALDPGGGRLPVRIEIRDTGEGIPDDRLDKIFDPFFTTKDSGNGLGLAITHGIIERHGGRIDVESHVGQGTTFVIQLPLNGEPTHA